MSAWLAAFLVTQLVEVPIYMRAQSGAWSRRFAIAFGASAITHPVVWFVFPRLIEDYMTMVIAAEVFAVVAEAIWLAGFGVRRPLLWSIATNSASLGIGLAIRATTGWV